MGWAVFSQRVLPKSMRVVSFKSPVAAQFGPNCAAEFSDKVPLPTHILLHTVLLLYTNTRHRAARRRRRPRCCRRPQLRRRTFCERRGLGWARPEACPDSCERQGLSIQHAGHQQPEGGPDRLQLRRVHSCVVRRNLSDVAQLARARARAT